MAMGPVPGFKFLQVVIYCFILSKTNRHTKTKIQRDRHKFKTRGWCSHHHSGAELKVQLETNHVSHGLGGPSHPPLQTARNTFQDYGLGSQDTSASYLWSCFNEEPAQVQF